MIVQPLMTKHTPFSVLLLRIFALEFFYWI